MIYIHDMSTWSAESIPDIPLHANTQIKQLLKHNTKWINRPWCSFNVRNVAYFRATKFKIVHLLTFVAVNTQMFCLNSFLFCISKSLEKKEEMAHKSQVQLIQNIVSRLAHTEHYVLNQCSILKHFNIARFILNIHTCLIWILTRAKMINWLVDQQ